MWYGEKIAFYATSDNFVFYKAMLYRGVELCFRTVKALVCRRQSYEI